MIRRLFNAAATLSMALCIATVIIWVRSFHAPAAFLNETWYRDGVPYRYRAGEYTSVDGSTESHPISFDVWDWGQEMHAVYYWHGLIAFVHHHGISHYVNQTPPSPRCAFTRDIDEEILDFTDPSFVNFHGFHFLSLAEPFYKYRVRSTTITVPAWSIVLLTILMPAIVFGRKATKWLRHRRGLCPTCGYDLRASKDRCPECGTAMAEKSEAAT